MLTLDLREFQAAMTRRVNEFHKDAAAELNKRAGDVCLRAIKLTPKTSQAKIEAELTREKPGSEGAKIYKNQYGTFSRKSSRSKNAFHLTGMAFALVNYYRKHGRLPRSQTPKFLRALGTGKPLFGQQLINVGRRLVKSKKSSTAYIAAGFIRAARHFGKTVTMRLSEKGKAADGEGIKATATLLEATIINASTGAEKVAGPALQQAVDSVVADMKKHMAQQLEKRWRK
jgi:hypothetical protein